MPASAVDAPPSKMSDARSAKQQAKSKQKQQTDALREVQHLVKAAGRVRVGAGG
jgi:hypothetical protein